MFNFYLYGKGYANASPEILRSNISDLVKICYGQPHEEDHFMMNPCRFWDVVISTKETLADAMFAREFWPDPQFTIMVLPRVFNSIKNTEENFLAAEEMDAEFPEKANAFYCALNHKGHPRVLTGYHAYTRFKSDTLRPQICKDIYDNRKLLFSRLDFCGKAIEQLEKGGTTNVAQIFDRLTELNRYAEESWGKGEKFRVDHLCDTTSLNASPESDATLNDSHLRNLRKFRLPDGSSPVFSLHLKFGDYRIHFLPADGKIYVGYIGPHLPTSKIK